MPRAVVADIPDQYVLSEAAGKLIASHRDSKKLSIFDLRGFRLEQVLDLDFDPEQGAFYYVRVLEIPKPTWYWKT